MISLYETRFKRDKVIYQMQCLWLMVQGIKKMRAACSLAKDVLEMAGNMLKVEQQTHPT